MQNETSKEKEQSEGQIEGRESGLKPAARSKYVQVSIRETDGHYLVSFNHGPMRVFHNMGEVLKAIETELMTLG